MDLTDKKVLILGSAALKIGEAGEFDYSGSQAIKALQEEGVYTILVNPNIATIQTSEDLADEVYFLPVNVEFVEKVIKKTRPDGILLGFGGQTALNTGMELQEKGILEKYNVKSYGTSVETIVNCEDRGKFVDRLDEIDVKTAKSKPAETVDKALSIAKDFGYPVIARVGYALGGLGSGVCYTEEELKDLTEKSFKHTSQILIEEYLEGWKEVEYEVMADRYGNCMIICNMENIDPMGIHTGESIVVSPSQTLSNRDYHILREIAIKTVLHLGVCGECNIQYAYDPKSEDYRVIEVNPRLSRSSALASKATGYPIAKIAAKLMLGHSIYELRNSITKSTSAFFEPALDYVVVKMPKWDLKKFRRVSRKIGTGMKSVGEVMAIGRNFEEAMQKAVRMLKIGAHGVDDHQKFDFEDLDEELQQPTEERIFAVSKALEEGYSIDKLHELTHINAWYLQKIKNIIDIKKDLREKKLDKSLLLSAKMAGFSDQQIGNIKKQKTEEIVSLRKDYKIYPKLRQIDTLAAEYPAKTNYLYLTYHSDKDDIESFPNNTVLLLGSGAYRIGSSVEFDWSCVTAGKTLRKLGYKTIMLNFNPETVSTDYDEFHYLVFDNIDLETVREVYQKFNPIGVIVSVGGQIANNLAMDLHKSGIRVLGTSPLDIDRAENRKNFSSMLDKLNIDQPQWKELTSMDEAKEFASEQGYPVLIRPSYVLSGAAMAVASNEDELKQYLDKAVTISPDYPTVISKFLDNAKEIEMDAVAQNGEIVAYAISEHVENAGVHSGDATMVLPPQRTYLETIRKIRIIGRKIASALNINGPLNIQFIAKNNQVKVIECNLRTSRSFPFVSKVMGNNFIDIATRVIMKVPVEKNLNSLFELDYVGVKAPQFSFTRLKGADPNLGVEMASTGEVGCLGDNFDEAFLKALNSVGYSFDIKSVLFSTGPIESKAELLDAARYLQKVGTTFYATAGTANFLESNDFPVKRLHWPLEEKQPNIIDYLKNGKIDLVINIPKNYQKEELTNGYLIRRAAIDYNVMLITNRQLVVRFIEALARDSHKKLKAAEWREHR
ncbi:MAG: carbamoyl-phosphate synthase (glutamine-hydrolyzing) large subunit [Candidatus Marinimicrobia bacterium]|nr:carbamoyl-phosphate synthase (glutamine-hydrolyzing) large subunit [Candidatus Neomarinimicrobiota bacterium]